MHQEFEKKLNLFRQEVLIAEDCFYSYITIHNLLADNMDLRRELNKNSIFWNTFLHSSQATFFIVLGRIFDKDEKSYSISHLLAYCMGHKEIFSKNQLEKRKVKDMSPQDLKKYVQHIPEEIVTNEDFNILKKQIDSCRDIHTKNYKKIRHKIFGHKDLKIIGQESKLYSKTSIGELKNILDFLYRVWLSIWELYNNGRELDVNNVNSSDYKDMIIKHTENVLNSFVTNS